VQAIDMAGEMGGETAVGDFGAAARATAEVEGFVEAGVDFPRGAERRGVAYQFFGDAEEIRVQRADLAARERGAVGCAKFVQIAKRGDLDEVLCVAEEIDDGDRADAVARGGVDEPLKLTVRVSAGAGDAGQRRIFDGVLKM
jgi:hypothetical protein